MLEIHARALERAAEIVGGKEALCDLLQVPVRSLEAWVAGDEAPPLGVFLKAVDLISASPPDGTGSIPEDIRAIQRAREIQASVLCVDPPAARSPNRRSIVAFTRQEFKPSEGRMMVDWALDAVVEGTGADMGNIQLCRPEGLVIVAQRGFGTPFLEFWASVRQEGSCGAARRARERVVVADVRSDPVFADGAARDVMEEARVRAVQSTPLMGRSGELLGVLSTHFEKPRQPTEMEFEVIDRIAERTAFWLGGGSA